MPEHLHLMIGYNVNQLTPDLVEEIKTVEFSEEYLFEFIDEIYGLD